MVPVLRRYARRAHRWIGATALAWLAGLGVFLAFTMPLWHPGQPVPLVVTIGVAGGLLMAATTSMITGAALRRLLRSVVRVSPPGTAGAPDPPTRSTMRPEPVRRRPGRRCGRILGAERATLVG